MPRLLRRAATCAGLAWGWSTPSYAQEKVPERSAPVVQQSPNGLYQLSITDTGIVLRGPAGSVTINSIGIQIGGPQAAQVMIEGVEFRLKAGQAATLEAGQAMMLDAGTTMRVKGSVSTDVVSDALTTLQGTRVALGCETNVRPVARAGDAVAVDTRVNATVVAAGSPKVSAC